MVVWGARAAAPPSPPASPAWEPWRRWRGGGSGGRPASAEVETCRPGAAEPAMQGSSRGCAAPAQPPASQPAGPAAAGREAGEWAPQQRQAAALRGVPSQRTGLHVRTRTEPAPAATNRRPTVAVCPVCRRPGSRRRRLGAALQ